MPVARRPRVALLQTGDELVLPGQGSGSDSEIVVSNAFGLAALARQAGAEVEDLGLIRDDQRASAPIGNHFSFFRKKGCNVLVQVFDVGVADRNNLHDTRHDGFLSLDNFVGGFSLGLKGLEGADALDISLADIAK